MFENKKILLIILLALSAFTHLVFFGYPNQTVFDEVHFGKFVSGYFTGQYFFDIHPPLGKLLISAMGYLTGFKPEFSFAQIGETYPDRRYYALRLLPTLAGLLLPLIIFGIALNLGLSKKASFFSGLLIVLENALLVQSRFILLDSLLLLFGFSALYCYQKFKKSAQDKKISWKYLWGTGILMALSGSIKWTGWGFTGLIIVLETLRLFPNFNRLKFWKGCSRPTLTHVIALVIVPVFIYMAIFAIHFALLPKSGPGDAFMSLAFQKTLTGNPHQTETEIQPAGFFKKFFELNLTMYTANQHLTAAHPYGSAWYSWPLMTRGIYFWDQTRPAPNPSAAILESKIYLLGNPAVWWASTIGLLYLLLNFLINLWRKKSGDNETARLILMGYFFNLLPFIGVQRVLFLYHYFPSLVFAILALAYALDQTKIKNWAMLTWGLVSLILFLAFSPLSYGLPLPHQNFSHFFWLPSWP